MHPQSHIRASFNVECSLYNEAFINVPTLSNINRSSIPPVTFQLPYLEYITINRAEVDVYKVYGFSWTGKKGPYRICVPTLCLTEIPKWY